MSDTTKRSLTAIGFAAISIAFVQIGTNMLAPLMAQIIADFGNDAPTTVILIQTLPSLGMVFGSLLFGVISRRVSNITVLIIASMGFALMGVMPIFLGHNLVPILISRLFVGICCGLFASMSVAVIAENFPKDKSANYMGYLLFAQSIGMIFFQTGAGFLSADNWRFALWLSLVSLVVMAIGLFTLPRRSKSKVDIATLEQSALDRKDKIKGMPLLVKYPPILFAFAIEIFFFYAGIFVLFVNASVLIDSAGFGSAWDAVLVLNVHTGCGIVFSLLFGRLFRIAKEYMLFIASVVGAVAFIFCFNANNVLFLCIGAGLLGFSAPSFAAAVFQLVRTYVPPIVVSTGTSAVVALQMLSGLCMVYMVEPLCNLFGLTFTTGRDPFLVYAVVYGVLAVVVLIQALLGQKKRIERTAHFHISEQEV